MKNLTMGPGKGDLGCEDGDSRILPTLDCVLSKNRCTFMFFFVFFAFDMLVETWVCMYASVSVCIRSVLS